MRLRGKKVSTESLYERLEGWAVPDVSQCKGRWREFFGNASPIRVELGMGKGRFINEMSLKFPDINFIGVDRYDELLRRAGEMAVRLRGELSGDFPRNLALVRHNVERIEEMFEPGEAELIYLNFSDPWPKKRHAKRRLTHPDFLEKYKRILPPGGEIHLKTDSILLFEYSLNTFSDAGFRLRNITFDLHRDGPPQDNVMTEYEEKFVSRGMPIYRCEAIAP